MVKKGGKGYLQNSGGIWLKGELKIQGGVWTLDELEPCVLLVKPLIERSL